MIKSLLDMNGEDYLLFDEAQNSVKSDDMYMLALAEANKIKRMELLQSALQLDDNNSKVKLALIIEEENTNVNKIAELQQLMNEEEIQIKQFFNDEFIGEFANYEDTYVYLSTMYNLAKLLIEENKKIEAQQYIQMILKLDLSDKLQARDLLNI